MKPALRFKSTSAFTIFSCFAISVAVSSCSKDVNGSTQQTYLSIPSVSREAEASLGSLTASAGIDSSAVVAWYNFNGGSLRDKSLYRNNITFSNATPATDRNGVPGNAYYFGGSSYMSVPNSASLSPTHGITLFAVVKVSGFYEGKCHGNRILSKGINSSINGVYYMDFSDAYVTNQMSCSIDTVDKQHENFSAAYGNFNTGRFIAEGDTLANVQTEHWYHLVFTYANGVASYYTDGKLTQRGTGTVAFTANGDDLIIGALNNPQYPYNLVGTIDQIGIFNKALNENQVARLSDF